jgi:serine/threonine protein kinase
MVFANDYRIESPLSAGGMGAVYVVEQLSTGKRRALKVMHPQLVSNPDLRKRFEREARIGSRIDSDHVVEVHAAGVDAATGTPYIIMELLRGNDLAHHLASGAMAKDQVRTLFEQLCHAVGAAHVAGVVHRDLKPENVFLAQSRLTGAGLVVKVLDFGIAKLAAEAGNAGNSTAPMGSPLWMPPEQTEHTTITSAADVWALGLIAYYMLTGKLFWRTAQFAEPSVQQLLREICLEPIPPASVRAAEVGCANLLPPDFDEWFARCVERDPTKRFPDARACWGGLAACLGVEPSSGPLLPRPNVPHASLGLTPSAPLPTAPPLATTPPPRPAAPAKGNSSMIMGAGAAGVLALAVVGGLVYRFMPSHASADVGPPAPSATAAVAAKPIESSAPLALAASAASVQLQEQEPPPMATLTAPAADAGGHAAAATTVAVSRGPVSAKPSADAVHAAMNNVLPGARQCSTYETSRADVIFRPDGGVLSVSVYDTDVSRVKDCVKAALSKAHVPPFSDPSYSVTVTVRPL